MSNRYTEGRAAILDNGVPLTITEILARLNAGSRDRGWVVVDPKGVLREYSFSRTRTDSIQKWMRLWDENVVNWRKFRREGFKCVRAERSIKTQS